MTVKVKRTFEGIALRADERVVFVGIVVVLQEMKTTFKLLVQSFCFLRIPEHVMIAAEEDLSPGKGFDVCEVLHAI